ncbi:hypothetical protein ACHAXS_008823 [Conticribra weissflogii]
MGCTSSSPANAEDLDATERVMKGRKGIDKTERIHTASERAKLAKRAQAPKSEPELPPPKLNENGQLMAEEVAKRISGSAEAKGIILGDIRSGNADGLIYVQYAVMTQRGYYPDNPHKQNQDEYYICPSKFGNGVGDAFFAVFDGHGDWGHDCARFAKNKLPAYLARNLKKARAALNAANLKKRDTSKPMPNDAFYPSSWPYLPEKEYEDACRQAFLQCNKAMHDDKSVKDTLSGTTAISVGFHAGRITVSNVGDSRCVLGYRIENDSTPMEEEKKEIGEVNFVSQSKDQKLSRGELIAIPLSEDQTPYRKDERERLKKAGARVMTIDQIDGLIPVNENRGLLDLGEDIDEEGDPPRVWCQDHKYPGTAFSRSLGDTVGEDIGVTAEPEIITKEITKGDEILVIASDGIFEFLTNQRVIDICSECDNPQQACANLLQASYEQWLHYELRTDDITCIVLFLKNGKPNDDEAVKKLMAINQRVKKAKTSKKPREDSMRQLEN